MGVYTLYSIYIASVRIVSRVIDKLLLFSDRGAAFQPYTRRHARKRNAHARFPSPQKKPEKRKEKNRHRLRLLLLLLLRRPGFSTYSKPTLFPPPFLFLPSPSQACPPLSRGSIDNPPTRPPPPPLSILLLQGMLLPLPLRSLPKPTPASD